MATRMFVRMISSSYNLIKCYCYIVDRPSWELVMMMMILIVENHSAFVEL